MTNRKDKTVKDMDHVEAAELLTKAVDCLYRNGYRVTGDLSICVPRQPERTEQTALLHLDKNKPRGASVLEFRARGVDGASVVASATPPELPTLSAATDAPGGSTTTTELSSIQLVGTAAGYTGETCITCGGARMQRCGTCAVCADCGATGGCS